VGSDLEGRAGMESVKMNWGNEIFWGSMRDIQQKSIWRWANKSSSRLDVEEGMECRNLVREFG